MLLLEGVEGLRKFTYLSNQEVQGIVMLVQKHTLSVDGKKVVAVRWVLGAGSGWRSVCQGQGLRAGRQAEKDGNASQESIYVAAGHNGLVAAAYLQKGGLQTAVLERRHVLGGAAVTEEIFPGFHFSRCSYLLSLLWPHIVTDVELKKHGLKVHMRDPHAFTPMLEEGVRGGPPRSLTLGSDLAENQKEIGKFSQKDAKAFSDFVLHLEKLSGAIHPLLDAPPVDIPFQKLAVDKLPNFLAAPTPDNKPGPHHQCSIHINCDRVDILEAAYTEAINGRPSTRPMIEMTIPSVLDRTLAPSGSHVVSMFTQFTPFHIEGREWTEQDREAFADNVFEWVEKYTPGFKESVVGRDILTPPDLESIFGLTGGNIFHGSMSLDQLYLARPLPSLSDYRTPIKGLYLCGSGSHPGGGVMGSPGWNAALTAMADLKRH
ncbi:pyridine nucleotide-disulfide oxidoreductase domain-containing protein 2-like [Festucalex cinctus]